jgi:hypothetical protein
MKKTAVYSWRLSPETKSALEHEARRTGQSLGALLEDLAAGWLRARRDAGGDDAEAQARLHLAVGRTLGLIAGGDPGRAQSARDRIRQRLKRRRAS